MLDDGTLPKQPRRLVLNTFFKRFGHHPAAWRHPSAFGSGGPDVGYWVRMAALAEQAKFDTFFLADFVGRSSDDLEQASRRSQDYGFEPLTLLSAVAMATSRIGLVATVNTNFSEPYHVARQFASLDHISGGRAGWNVVSSLSDGPVKNFGLPRQLDHAERYERAAEFVGVTKALWDSWEDGVFDRPNRAEGRFFDPRSAHAVAHSGKHFRVHGLLDVARPIQGYPVLVQAGNSETGRDFAAEIAEMTYCSAQTLGDAQAYYSDVKGRMAKFGREPGQLKVTPGLSVLVADTDSEARERFDELQGLVDFTRVELGGVDLSGHPLDGPVPDLPEGKNGKGRFQQLMKLARAENLSIRELVLRFSVSRGHLQAVGSVKTVVDTMEQWFVERGADGFNVVPPLLPGGFEDFVRLVVPELQRRGLARTEYEGSTYRENLGLLRPPGRRPISAPATGVSLEARS